MPRQIDRAMGDNRPEKETMRRLWTEAVTEAERHAGNGSGNPPLYLTLPGAHGHDIQRLIEEGIVGLAENGAIAPADLWKVVAVERNNEASLNLKSRLKGLRVLTEDIKGVLASTGPLTWPRRENERWCRAHVVNLDFNGALLCERDSNGHAVFPTIQLIWKLAHLHLKEPALDWVLCLTVAAEIPWSAEDCQTVQRFLAENFNNEEQFARDSRELLGDALFEALLSKDPLDFGALDGSEKQALLMVFVPKKIIAETYVSGWSVTTSHNLRYGGHSRSHRMVSWIIRFKREPRVAEQPRAIYSESLAEALVGAGAIAPDGELRLE